jgi:hypothetical protein
MCQQDVFERNVRTEMLFQMADYVFARLGRAAINQQELIVVLIAIANNDGISGLASRANR